MPPFLMNKFTYMFLLLHGYLTKIEIAVCIPLHALEQLISSLVCLVKSLSKVSFGLC